MKKIKRRFFKYLLPVAATGIILPSCSSCSCSFNDSGNIGNRFTWHDHHNYYTGYTEIFQGEEENILTASWHETEYGLCLMMIHFGFKTSKIDEHPLLETYNAVSWKINGDHLFADWAAHEEYTGYIELTYNGREIGSTLNIEFILNYQGYSYQYFLYLNIN